MGGQRHGPAALPAEKTWYPLYRRLRGPQGRSEEVRKISPPTGIRSPDRPARSQSLYPLSYPDPPSPDGTRRNLGFFFQYLKYTNINFTNKIVLIVSKCRENIYILYTKKILSCSNINTDFPLSYTFNRVKVEK